MAKSESVRPSQGKIPPTRKEPPAIRHQRVEERRREKGALVEPQMILKVRQTRHDGKAFDPADGLEIVETQIVAIHFLRAAVENRNKGDRCHGTEEDQPAQSSQGIRLSERAFAKKAYGQDTEGGGRTDGQEGGRESSINGEEEVRYLKRSHKQAVAEPGRMKERSQPG